MSRSLRVVFAFAVFSVVFGGVSLFAQTTTGRIVGTVTDEGGAIIPGVEIVVRNPATGLSRNVVTNETGTYTVPLLPPAVYEIEVSLPGFRREVRSGVTLQVDAVVRMDFSLRVGSLQDEIKVIADAPLLQSETAALGQVMDSQKVTDIPLNQRHFMMLTVLTAGIMPTVQGSNLSSQNMSFHANGGRERDNNFLLDGVDNNDPGNGQLNIVPSVDAIQEFKIQTSTYGAEFGRAAGGVLNVQTKSGTNDFHLTLFEFLRNDVFDARNFFATSKRPYRRNQFGTVLSGPILKDRMFYMFNYEGNRIRRTDTALATVPDLRMRAGDFSGLSRQLIDPATGQPFPGNIVPTSRFDRLGTAMAAFYPEPNRGVSGGNNYLSTGKGTWDFDIITSRVDYRVSDKQNLFVRFMWQDSYQIESGLEGGGLPNYGTVYFQPIGRNVGISDTYVFGPRVVNEFRVGFNRLIGGLFGTLYERNYAKELGITGVQSELHPTVGKYPNYGLPSISVTGFSGMGGGSNQIRHDNTWHFFDLIAVTRGNHQMRMGGEARTLMFNYDSGVTANGSFTFDGRYSGNAFADMLLGYPSRTSRGLGNARSHTRDRQFGAFFQDDWKVTPQFTLNLGVRWEFTGPFVDANDGQAVFDTKSRQIVIAGESGPQVFPHPVIPGQTITIAGGKDFGIPRGMYHKDWNNFAPRFGFAWSPKALNMVVRGGYGVFTGPEIPNPHYNFRHSSYPWVIPQTFIGAASIPNINLRDPFPEALGQSSITARAIDVNWRNGYMQQWNLGMQRPLGTDTVLDVSYSGSKGTKLTSSRDINQPPLGPGSVDSRRPFPGWGSITQQERAQASNFHSLQTKFERRFSAGLTFVTAYTWGHSIDDNGSQDDYNRRADRGNSTWDIRHRLVNSYSYELPFGPQKRFLSGLSGIGNLLLGGWEVAGITTFSTGQSFTPSASGDIAQIGGSSVRPNRIADGNLPRDERNASRWFDTSAFVIPATGTFGNSARNILKGPGINSWDLTLMKNMRLAERQRVEFRVEFFNAFNHPNFNLPTASLNSPAFGTITSAKDARQIQFGLKYQR